MGEVEKLRAYEVFGEIRIPVSIISTGLNDQEAIERVVMAINNLTIQMDKFNLGVINGKTYTLDAHDVDINWQDYRECYFVKNENMPLNTGIFNG